MKHPKLTDPALAARTAKMQYLIRAKGAAMLLGGAMALSACVSVAAPDKPIVIELNINIKQEVIYRLAKDADVPEGPLEFPPELVVEVRSPSDGVRAMTDKAYEYLEAGVRVAVVFDPPTESVGVFRAGELPQRYSNGDDLKLSDVLPGFAVPVRRFFG